MTGRLYLRDLTDPGAVKQAMAEADKIGRDAFLAKYGFGRAKSYFLVEGNKKYDSKAIAAAAYGYQFPNRGALRSDEFSGGEKTVQARLKALGFAVQKLSSPSGIDMRQDCTIQGLGAGDVLTNSQLMALFKVSNSGGMRRSLQTNTLVLISDYTKSLYLDEWRGDVLHYCGMGTKEDQRLDFMQNRTLAESNTNGVAVYLFEVYKRNAYTYIGPVRLVEKPYTSEQRDARNSIRRVWIFPIQLVSGMLPAPPLDSFRQIENRQRKQARSLDDAELEERAKKNGGQPASRTASSKVYVRNQDVAEFARRRAKGRCDLCSAPAPFVGRDGEAFLEVHHVIWLANGGEDTISNTVALCPNCHRKMHNLNDANDRQTLMAKASEKSK